MTAARFITNEVKGFHWFIKFMMLLVGISAVASLLRFIFGLGATTNMNDTYPWGLWISFDVVTAVPLAAGAFTLGAIVHCFNIKKLEPLVRPAIVTGFLGYSLVAVGLLLDLGQPQRGWHVLRSSRLWRRSSGGTYRYGSCAGWKCLWSLPLLQSPLCTSRPWEPSS